MAVLRATLIVVGVLGALWAIWQLSTLILVLVFAVLFAYVLAPLVAFVRRYLLQRGRTEGGRGGAGLTV